MKLGRNSLGYWVQAGGTFFLTLSAVLAIYPSHMSPPGYFATLFGGLGLGGWLFGAYILGRSHLESAKEADESLGQLIQKTTTMERQITALVQDVRQALAAQADIGKIAASVEGLGKAVSNTQERMQEQSSHIISRLTHSLSLVAKQLEDAALNEDVDRLRRRVEELEGLPKKISVEFFSLRQQVGTAIGLINELPGIDGQS